MRARRSDALVSLMDAQLAQERHRANNRSYGDLAAIGQRRTSLSGHYAIEVAASALRRLRAGRHRHRPAGARHDLQDAAHRRRRRQHRLRLRARCGSVERDRGQPQVLEPVMRHASFIARPVDRRAARRQRGRAGDRRGRDHGRRPPRAREPDADDRNEVGAGPAHRRRHRRPRPAPRRLLGRLGLGRAQRRRQRGARQSLCAGRDRKPPRRMRCASASRATSSENGSVDGNERFGFRLRSGAIELQLGDGNWQALTDPATLTVTAFEVEPRTEETSLERFCAEPCAAGSSEPARRGSRCAASLTARRRRSGRGPPKGGPPPVALRRRSPRLPLRRRQRRLGRDRCEHRASAGLCRRRRLAPGAEFPGRARRPGLPGRERRWLAFRRPRHAATSTLTSPDARLERLATDRRRSERLRRSDARGARARRAGGGPLRSQPAGRLRHRRSRRPRRRPRPHPGNGRPARRGDGPARRRRAAAPTCAAPRSSSASSPARTTAARRPAPMRSSPPASAGW